MSMPVDRAFSVSRAINHGWEAVKRAPLPILLGSFLLGSTSGSGGGGGNPGSLGGGSGSGDELDMMVIGVLIAVALVGMVCGTAIWLFRSWLHTGALRVHENVVTRGRSDFGVLFSGGDRFMQMALGKLLRFMILVILGGVVGSVVAVGSLGASMTGSVALMYAVFAFCAVFFVPLLIYVALGLSLMDYAIGLDGLSAMDGLRRSWSVASGNRIHLLFYYLVTGFFSILGFLACCVGIFVTSAMVDVGTTEAWLLATRDDTDDYELMKNSY